MMKEFGYFNLITSFRMKKGRKRETKSMSIHMKGVFMGRFVSVSVSVSVECECVVL